MSQNSTTATTNQADIVEELVTPGSGRPTDIVILVMGPLKSGKSSFVNKVLEVHGLKGHMEVNNRLAPTTTSVQSAVLTIPKLLPARVIVVDTPGLQDDWIADANMLTTVNSWIQAIYARANGPALCNIIYLHDISQEAFSTTACRLFELAPTVVPATKSGTLTLVTTKWYKVSELEGTQRENQLKASFWPDPTGYRLHRISSQISEAPLGHILDASFPAGNALAVSCSCAKDSTQPPDPPQSSTLA